MKKPTPAARSRARRFALQALYQIQLSGCSAAEVESQFRHDFDMKRVDTAYLHDLISGIDSELAELVDAFVPALDRPEGELGPVEKAILLIGTYELLHRIDIPFRVVINENVELAKQFGGSESHRLINSVLDSVARQHRTAEIRSRE